MRAPSILWALPLLSLACGSVKNTVPDGGGGGNDGDGGADNRAPAIESVDVPELIAFGDTVALACNASDPDGDTLTFAWTSSAGAFIGTGSEVDLDASGVNEGPVEVTCTVSDGRGGEDEQTAGSLVLVAPGDLVGRYEFDGDAMDASGNGNHGTFDGTPPFVADRFGNTAAAVSLDGSVAAQLANESNFDLTTFTITAWIQIGPAQFSRFLISKGSIAGNYNLELLGDGAANDPGLLKERHVDAAGSRFDALMSNTALPQDQWVHIAVTMAPSELFGYVDGEVGRSFANPPQPALNDNPVFIGNDGQNEQFYDGDIDDLRIYSRALTADEVAAIAGFR